MGDHFHTDDGEPIVRTPRTSVARRWLTDRKIEQLAEWVERVDLGSRNEAMLARTCHGRVTFS